MNMQTSWELDVGGRSTEGKRPAGCTASDGVTYAGTGFFSTRLMAHLALSRAHFGARMERRGPIRLMPLSFPKTANSASACFAGRGRPADLGPDQISVNLRAVGDFWWVSSKVSTSFTCLAGA